MTSPYPANVAGVSIPEGVVHQAPSTAAWGGIFALTAAYSGAQGVPSCRNAAVCSPKSRQQLHSSPKVFPAAAEDPLLVPLFHPQLSRHTADPETYDPDLEYTRLVSRPGSCCQCYAGP